jgi:hypothetical protein
MVMAYAATFGGSLVYTSDVDDLQTISRHFPEVRILGVCCRLVVPSGTKLVTVERFAAVVSRPRLRAPSASPGGARLEAVRTGVACANGVPVSRRATAIHRTHTLRHNIEPEMPRE